MLALAPMERTDHDRFEWDCDEMTRVASLVVAGLLLSGSAFGQASQSWPERPVRFIVPFQPGSSSDTVARVIAQKLGERLGQQFVVDNRVGASGNVGTEAIARAEPDGYTIGLPIRVRTPSP
jgi:tripartite-type tricarboxylate transporter receptor subunit TctC